MVEFVGWGYSITFDEKESQMPRTKSKAPSEMNVTEFRTWKKSLLDEQDLCRELHIKLSTLRTWRSVGKAPRGMKIGRNFFYEPEQVQKFMFDHTEG